MTTKLNKEERYIIHLLKAIMNYYADQDCGHDLAFAKQDTVKALRTRKYIKLCHGQYTLTHRAITELKLKVVK